MVDGCHARIDVRALQHNYRALERRAAGAGIVAVIKADGYGHGLVTVARALAAAPMLAVATIAEALQLRRAGVGAEILVLQGFADEHGLAQSIENGLIPVIHAGHQVRLVAETATRWRCLWLKLQSGMYRLGLPPGDFSEAHRRLAGCADRIVLMTHLACAEVSGDASVSAQIACFDEVVADLAGGHSIANSAALWSLPQSRRQWVRPGIMLYGVSPFAGKTGAELGLEPVMTLRARLIAVQDCEAGRRVGYGLRYCCQSRTRIGVVGIGYGDGYPRHAADGTPVRVNGESATVAGVPSMDMLTVDLGAGSRAQPGDPVELWGRQVPVEWVARQAGTIPYELLSRLTSRVPLRVIGDR